MRTFIVSDLHGNGEVYNSIMAYIENVNKEEKVKLYINGDLHDRGLASFDMLMDVMNRINNKESFIIEYLAGNHELMMWQALSKRKPGQYILRDSLWLKNGGDFTYNKIDQQEDCDELCEKIKNFVGNLKIYNLFDEEIAGKKLLLVHASAPKKVEEICDLTIADYNIVVDKALWDREDNEFFPFLKNKLGKDGYLTIIGHTPVDDPRGFIYNEKENYFNIDGGCARYAIGYFRYDHVPLVEVRDGGLEFLIFNHNNEIIDGYAYYGRLTKLSDVTLNQRRTYIDHNYDDCRSKGQELIKEKLRFY